MKVIGAGFPKTGTKTLNSALTILGYKVYDYIENVYELEDDWTKIFSDGGSTEDFRRMFQNADAVVDAPPCYFWREIQEAFPQAKVILTIRESDDVWFQSLRRHFDVASGSVILRILSLLSPTCRRNQQNVVDPMLAAIFGIECSSWHINQHLNETLLKIKYRSHNADVKQNATKGSLLIYNCAEGWEPLCEFLEVPVPNEPFPIENTGSSFLRSTLKSNPVFRRMKREVVLLLAASTFLTSGLLYFCYNWPNFAQAAISNLLKIPLNLLP